MVNEWWMNDECWMNDEWMINDEWMMNEVFSYQSEIMASVSGGNIA